MRRDFDNRLEEIAAARRFACGVVGSHPRADDVRVIVSELATNAVRHASSGFRLTIDQVGSVLRIVCSDHGPGSPEPGADRAISGRGGFGLHLVDALAERWGVEGGPGEKCVWAELDEAWTG